MSNETELEKTVRLSTMALRDIAARGECDYLHEPSKSRPRPCPCAKCVASEILEAIEDGPNNWRYLGARPQRTRTCARERKIVEAWRSQVDDRTLGMVLSEDDPGATYQTVAAPSVRDWFVATSVVQWLATNVGMEVLRRAGFEYKGFDADRKERERQGVL